MRSSSRRTVELGGRDFETLTFSMSAISKGHDRLQIDDDFLAVADGATPLAADWPDPGAFADRALAALRCHALTTGEPRRMWAESIRSTSRPAEHRPHEVSCAVAMVRTPRPGLVEFSSLGDCASYVCLRQGSGFTLTDDTVRRRDVAAARDSSDRVRLHQRLVQDRLQMNTETGYWIYGADPTAADHVVVRSCQASDVDRFLLTTDGGALLGPAPSGHEQGWPDLMSAFATAGPTGLASWLDAVTALDDIADDVAIVAAWAEG